MFGVGGMKSGVQIAFWAFCVMVIGFEQILAMDSKQFSTNPFITK